MNTDSYEEGMDANQDGFPLKANPYADGDPRRVWWARGWNDFQPIREQFESETHARARLYS